MSVHTDKTFSRFQPGTSLPIRNAPNPVVPDTEKDPPPHYQEFALTRIARSLDKIGAMLPDLTRLVEETAGDTTLNEITGETQLNWMAQFEPASELITSVLVVGPPSTAFTLQLGNRQMALVTDTSGKVILSPVAFILKPDSTRQLTVNGSAISQSAFGSVTDPSAFDGFVFTPTLQPGTYLVTVTAFLSGTVEAADAANMEITGSGISGARIPVPPAANVPVTTTQQLVLTTAEAIGVQSITAGSNAAVIYNANITAQLIGGGNSVNPGPWFVDLSGHAITSRRYG